MWVKSYSKVFNNVSKEQIWKTLVDINNWPKWDLELEYTKLLEPFKIGATFILKPKRGPKVSIKIVEVIEGEKFTDCTSFPGAKMYAMHELSQEKEGLRLTTTLKVVGIFRFLWRKLVAEKIIAAEPVQMEALVSLARSSE